jgi:hypothetical protein
MYVNLMIANFLIYWELTYISRSHFLSTGGKASPPYCTSEGSLPVA